MTISEKLDKVIENQAKDSVRFANYEKAQAEVHVTLYDKEAGVVIDVDRLKVFKKLSCWFYAVIIGGGLTVMFKLLYSHLAG